MALYLPIILFVLFLLALAILGPRFGVDSRDGKDWWTVARRLSHR